MAHLCSPKMSHVQPTQRPPAPLERKHRPRNTPTTRRANRPVASSSRAGQHASLPCPARTLSDVTPRQTRLLSQTEPLYDVSRGTKIRGDEILPDVKTCDHAVGRVLDMGLRLARQVGLRARPHAKRVARGRPVCGRGFWMTRLLDLSCINSRSRRLCVSCENHVKINVIVCIAGELSRGWDRKEDGRCVSLCW